MYEYQVISFLLKREIIIIIINLLVFNVATLEKLSALSYESAALGESALQNSFLDGMNRMRDCFNSFQKNVTSVDYSTLSKPQKNILDSNIRGIILPGNLTQSQMKPFRPAIYQPQEVYDCVVRCLSPSMFSHC